MINKGEVSLRRDPREHHKQPRPAGHQLQASPFGRETEDPEVQRNQARPRRRQSSQRPRSAVLNIRAGAVCVGDRARARVPPSHPDVREAFVAVLVGILVFLGRSILISQVTDSLVKTESVRPAAHAVLTIATEMLSEIAGAFIFIGAPLIAAAWFAGPARLACQRSRGDRAVFARTCRVDIHDRRRHHDPDLHLGPDPGDGVAAGIIVFLVSRSSGPICYAARPTQNSLPQRPTAHASLDSGAGRPPPALCAVRLE